MENSGKRPFACYLCELRFTSKQFLHRHFIVHSDERSFKCNFCENAYKYKKGLNRHYKKTHTEYYETKIFAGQSNNNIKTSSDSVSEIEKKNGNKCQKRKVIVEKNVSIIYDQSKYE